MSKEVKVEATEDGLAFSEDLSAEELSQAINRLADTYCTDADCLNGKVEKCEVCKIGDKAHAIRRRLLGEGNH